MCFKMTAWYVVDEVDEVKHAGKRLLEQDRAATGAALKAQWAPCAYMGALQLRLDVSTSVSVVVGLHNPQDVHPPRKIQNKSGLGTLGRSINAEEASSVPCP